MTCTDVMKHNTGQTWSTGSWFDRLFAVASPNNVCLLPQKCRNLLLDSANSAAVTKIKMEPKAFKVFTEKSWKHNCFVVSVHLPAYPFVRAREALNEFLSNLSSKVFTEICGLVLGFIALQQFWACVLCLEIHYMGITKDGSNNKKRDKWLQWRK